MSQPEPSRTSQRLLPTGRSPATSEGLLTSRFPSAIAEEPPPSRFSASATPSASKSPVSSGSGHTHRMRNPASHRPRPATEGDPPSRSPPPFADGGARCELRPFRDCQVPPPGPRRPEVGENRRAPGVPLPRTESRPNAVPGTIRGIRPESHAMAGREDERLVVAVTSGPTGEPSIEKKSPLTPARGVASPRGIMAVTAFRVRVTPSSSKAGTTTSFKSHRVRSADTRWTAQGPPADHTKW